jgi:outer membrane protein assembly factor BamB
MSREKKKIAYLSPDKKGVVIIDGNTQSINIFNPKGQQIGKIPLRKFPKGPLGFSDTRLFDFNGGLINSAGGFYIYDFSGKLIKKVDNGGIVSAFMVSNNQKYLAVQAGRPETGDYFALYDMDGNELWRHKTDIGGYTNIQFSLDDKYLLVKMPLYWTNNTGDPKSQKLYIFDVSNGNLTSEEHYED